MPLCKFCGMVDTYGGEGVCSQCEPRSGRLVVTMTPATMRRLRALSEKVSLTTGDIVRAAINEFLDEREQDVSQAKDLDA